MLSNNSSVINTIYYSIFSWRDFDLIDWSVHISGYMLTCSHIEIRVSASFKFANQRSKWDTLGLLSLSKIILSICEKATCSQEELQETPKHPLLKYKRGSLDNASFDQRPDTEDSVVSFLVLYYILGQPYIKWIKWKLIFVHVPLSMIFMSKIFLFTCDEITKKCAA